MTGTDAQPAQHRIEFSLDTFGVETRATCTDTSTSPCHRTCVRPGHDECDCTGDDLTDYGRCVITEWLNAEGTMEAYEGERAWPIATLDIAVRWDGDCYRWKPLDPAEPRQRIHKCGWCDQPGTRSLTIEPNDANQPITVATWCDDHGSEGVAWFMRAQNPAAVGGAA